MTDEHRISSVPAAPWLPSGSTAEVWAGRDCAIPEPCIIVRLLLVRHGADGVEFFSVPTHRGLDLPSLTLATGSTVMTAAKGVTVLASKTHGSADTRHLRVGYIRNVVPNPDSSYPHPTPWAHVPVFEPVEAVEPSCDGAWMTLDSARSVLSTRHWWPVVEHRLATLGSR